MTVSLRAYQTTALNDLRALLVAGFLRLLLVSPTGSGKTTIAAEMIRSALQKATQQERWVCILFLAHRKELIDQCSARLDSFGVDHGVLMAQHWRWRPLASVQVASVQTLSRRPRESWPKATLIIVDEAHHARAGTYESILVEYPGVPVVGLTATPWRQDNKGLGDLFQRSVLATTPAQLIREGHLVDFTGYGFHNPDLSDVATVRGEYNERQLALAVGTTAIIGGIVERWLERANGQRTVAFAVNVTHSKEIVQRFQAAGVAAEHLDGTMPKAIREAILGRLASGETKVVANCGILTEGYDLPLLTCCILARPTKSLALFLQCVGRVLRPAPGKARALIHDHAGCLLFHGLPDEDRDYGLQCERKKGPRAEMIITCPKCSVVYRRQLPACPECGAANPTAAGAGGDRKVKELEHAPEFEIDAIRKLRAASVEQKAAEYKRLKGIQSANGWTSTWAEREFKKTFGHVAAFSEELLARVPAAEQPPLPLDELRSLLATPRRTG